MPPKRKLKAAATVSERNSADDGGAGPGPGKKTKKDDSDDGAGSFRLIWQYESKKNQWTDWSEDAIETINEAHESKKKQVEIADDDTNFVLNFSKMVKKSKTGYEAQIRCCVQYGNIKNVCFAWHWKDSQGIAHYYSPDQMLVLESAFQNKDSIVSLKISTRKYTIDLNAWTQTANTSKETYTLVRSREATKLDFMAPAPAVSSNDKLKKVAKSKKSGSESAATGSGDTVKTITMTGKVPVDSECEQKMGSAHVFEDDDAVWDVMLNQTNLQFNNNKYYLMQLLEDNKAKQYSVWFRWGRVGQKGQRKLESCGPNLEKAKNTFAKKFQEKTKNLWEERDSFKKMSGKYDLLHMDYSANDTDKKVEEKPRSTPRVDSTLHNKVKALIELICNVKAMEDIVLEMKYDAKKAPLGKLTTEQIKAGYSALKRIEELITSNETGRTLIDACNNFYTRIPHNFGMKTPPLIRTLAEIREKIMLLEALGDIQIAMKLMNQESDVLLHPADNHYRSLKCELTPLEKQNDEFELIEKYLLNTHADTHNQYSLTIEDIFSCKKESEFLDVGNRMLLWHGSRLTNWAGILGQGLRIAPPEAPVTGYMFGKGVYFADMCSKSANYCFANRTQNTGLLLLCEVSLGKCNELLNADYNANNLPKDKKSVKGKGRVVPNPSDVLTLPDGTIVPLGKGITLSVDKNNRYTLNYNEYIVYDVRQIRMRYLIKVKFGFKY